MRLSTPRSLAIGILTALSFSTIAEAASEGKASYYQARHGGLTAAHRTLPFGTRVRVTNLANHRTAVVTIDDRGPFIRGRIIDVSVPAANVLGLRQSGVAPVRIEVVSQ